MTPGAESRAMQDSCMLGVYPLTDRRKHAPHGCRWPKPSFQLYSLWGLPEDVFFEARLYFPSASAHVTLDASFYLPIYIFSFMVFGPEHQSSISAKTFFFFLTHVENVRSQYSLIKLVKMSGNDTIIQYFRGNKQHLHDFGLINQVKWWDVIKNMPLIPGVWS